MEGNVFVYNGRNMKREHILRKLEYFADLDLSHSYDSLTSILGRDAMISYAEWLISKNKPFSFFIIDIDNFKNINDTYGHLVGDMVLSQTAQYFVTLTETKGVVARYGGDEFLMLFEDVVDYNDIWNIGHDIDMSIGRLVFEGIPNLAITVSIGISRYPENAQTFDEILSVADKALYRAKMKGRNCFIIYLPEKHANISLQHEREKRLTSMQLCFNVFNSLTACGEDISLAISTMFKSLISYYMFDHICVESHKAINHSVVFTLSRHKTFRHISFEEIDSHLGAIGYATINNRGKSEEEETDSLIKEIDKQNISSSLYCKISAYGTDYGFIRIDTTSTTRIWQNAEISIIMMAANYLAMLLHYQHKTLEQLPTVAPIEAGSIE